MRPTQPTKKPAVKREPDDFQIARRVAIARAKHRAQMADLFAAASPTVQALIEAFEEAEANQPIVLAERTMEGGEG